MNSWSLVKLIFIAAIMTLVGCSPKPAKTTVTVTFIIKVPPRTSVSDPICICGNLKEVGNWDGKGAAAIRQSDGTHLLTLELPRGDQLEYKITRGNWNSVEKGKDGEELPNRTLELNADRTERVVVESWSLGVARKPSGSGDIRIHDAFKSEVLKNQRKLIVWLPPQYKDEPERRFPVLYMHDGQNCFDDATSFSGEWHADEIAAKLIAEKKIEPIIIVGVENLGKARSYEYTPIYDEFEKDGGGAEFYAQFLINEVKPFIDTTYRTKPSREDTAVCGSSLGGLMTLYLGWKHGDTYSKLGVISPSLWWNDNWIINKIVNDKSWMKRERIWLDMGSKEGPYKDPERDVRNARFLAMMFGQGGMKSGKDFVYKEVEGASHNEAAWSARFDEVLVFLFGK